MILITKRDGSIVPFESDKIRKAVLKATAETQSGEDSDLARLIAGRVEAYYSMEHAPDCTVEDVQDMVEKLLMDSDNKEAAKKYILYRDKRSRERLKNTEFMRTIGEKITASNVQNQNANVDEASFGGRKGEAANELLRRYAIENLLSPLARERHLNNEIYIHDLDSYAIGNHNCLTIPFDDLLANGFNTRQTDVRPANSINTAFQLLAVIFQLQSLQQFGGCSAGHLDWTMVPYVRKSFYKHFIDGFAFQEGNPPVNEPNIPIKDLSIEDPWYAKEVFEKPYQYALEMTKRELKQAVEGMYHNLNTLQSRSGNQLPFTSINYGTCTLPEGRMVIRALLEGSIAGVGKLHRTPIFPCGIFQCMKGVNRKPGDPNYDLFRLALKSTASRLYPNYANVDWSNNAGYDKNDPRTYFGTMGCRTANLMDVNGLGQLKDGRGNICPVTIILPTIAMQAKEITAPGENVVDNFFQLLDHRIDDAKEMLLERFNYICSQPPEAAKFMYENRLMAGYVPEEGIRSALKHGTLAIGQIGLAECLQILIGCNHLDLAGMELAKTIERLFKYKCAKFKEECQLNFGVYYTPGFLRGLAS